MLSVSTAVTGAAIALTVGHKLRPLSQKISSIYLVFMVLDCDLVRLDGVKGRGLYLYTFLSSPEGQAIG